jgi:hypothetical protein
MNKNTLDAILERKGIQIPNDFYNYLTTVSENYVVYTYWGPETDNEESTHFYDDNHHTRKSTLDFPDSSDCQIFIPETEKTTLEYKCFYKITFTTLFCYYIYLGQGPHYGSIWVNTDDTNHSTLFELKRMFDTFEQFFNRVNELKQDPENFTDCYDYYF